MLQFTGIIGDPGSGKSNLLTSIGYDAHKKGLKVIANYKLNFPYQLMPFSEIAKMPEDLFHSVVLMDELGKGADSYDFFSKDSRRIVTIVTQLRKRHCLVYYTVQRFAWIAKRLRERTDGYVLMQDLDGHIPHHGLKQPYTCQGLFQASFLNSYYEKISESVFDGKPTRDLYDTDEIIWSDEELAEFAQRKNKARPELGLDYQVLDS